MNRYKPVDMMIEEKKELERNKQEAEEYVTTTKGKTLKIKMVGFEKSYNWRADLANARHITLEKMGILELDDSGDLRRLIPGTINL